MRLFAAALALASLSLSPAVAARPVQFAQTVPSEGAFILPLGRAGGLAVRGTMLDEASRNAVARALQASGFEYKRNATLSLRGIGPWSQILVVGTGNVPLSAEQLQDLGGTAARGTASEDAPVTLVASGIEMVPGAAAQIGIGEGGAPGAGLGAHFIGSFVTPATPWAHIDIAGTAWTSSDAPTVPTGAAGMTVRLLDRFVRDFRPVPAPAAD